MWGRRPARSPIQRAVFYQMRELPMFRSGLFASLIVAGVGMTNPSFAQSTVYIPAILELSGAGAVSGTNFRDGMLLAIDEINAKGGILGKKIDTPLLDTQSDAGTSRAQVQKVLDNNPYVIRAAIQHAEDRQLHARRHQGKDRCSAVGEQRFRQRRSGHLY